MPRPIRSRQDAALITTRDLRDDFLARCQVKNLTPRTVEWYEFKLNGFIKWCDDQDVLLAQHLTTNILEDFLMYQATLGASPNTIRGSAQVLKTLCRFGTRKGYMPDIITGQFEMPKVPQTLISTFSDEQLVALLEAPSQRKWTGVRDKALMLMMFDTMARLSEIASLRDKDVDLEERVIRVMGKGRKERDIPLGKASALAAARYRRTVQDLEPEDPFFITQYGREMNRRTIYDIVHDYGLRSGIKGVRCSPHTLRHTGAKLFILSGGDVFSLQRILGHTTMYMVRRYVQLTDIEVRKQHSLHSPGDRLLSKPKPDRAFRKKKSPRPTAPGEPID